jgi:hypothetical protein
VRREKHTTCYFEPDEGIGRAVDGGVRDDQRNRAP